MQILYVSLLAFVGVFGEWSERGKELWMRKYPEEFDELVNQDIEFRSVAQRKNGLRNEFARWPNALVPYDIHGPYTKEECKIIESAFDHYHTNTCIRFRIRNESDTDYVRIINEPGCHSEVGRVGGEQILNIGEGPCVTEGTIMHELMHVLGFMHEQKRHDRDNYIKILYENLRPDKVTNFDKQSEDVVTSFGVEYDYDSITHYSPLAFSKNGKPTVMVRKKVKVNLGQREYLSEGDIRKLNLMYNCSSEYITSRPTFDKLC